MPTEKDRAAEVLGLANIVISFRLTWPDDVDTVGRLLFPKNICYDRLYHDLYQHQGDYTWLRVRETSRQLSVQQQWSQANAQGEDESEQVQETESDAVQATWSTAKGTSRGSGTAEMNGWANGDNASTGETASPIIVDGEVKRTLRLNNRSSGGSHTRNGAITASSQENETESASQGGGSTTTRGISKGRGRSTRRMKTKTEGAGITQGVSESDKLLPLPKLVHVRQDSGQLQEGTPDLQYERFGCELSSLDRQEAFVRIRGGKAMKFRTADVADPFVSAEAQMKAVAWFKKHLYQTHDYFFTPTVDDTDHEMSRSNETGHEITMIELPADAEFIVEEESPML